MSDQGEKMCPLCAEDMDLTDQQLKPCRCGYEICVWCWHHIMDMAEKDETGGRCPACRAPYDKEKIVGMAANCERLVAGINTDRKKSQKVKTKTSEGRKQLSSVRVIQRNLVYIVGLPLNLADEDLLQHRDYFGQYGKVLKVSISRTSAGTIQQFANITCSVYIAYSKEEEAVRCIQSVHGFVLEGRSLRACFGTTKYCHAWLRNVPCTNSDCLYLHEIGSQEDSFTKDEIISAYTRVQQITGVTNNVQRRSGNVLPPPVDDYCYNNCTATGQPVVKSTVNISTSSVIGTSPANSSGRPGVLPLAASWGTRASTLQSSAGSLLCSNGPSKHKADTISGSKAFSTAVVGTIQTSNLVNDVGKKLMSNEESFLKNPIHKSEAIDNLKQHYGSNPQVNVSEVSVTPLGALASKALGSGLPSPAETEENNKEARLQSTIDPFVDRQSNISILEKEMSVSTDGRVQKLYSDLSSLGTDKQLNSEDSEVIQPNGLHLDNLLLPGSQGLRQQDHANFPLHLRSPVVSKATTFVDGVRASSEACPWRSDVMTPSVQNLPSEMPGMLDNWRLREAVVDDQKTSHNLSHSHSLHLLNHDSSQIQHANTDNAVNYKVNPPIAIREADETLATIASSAPVVSYGNLGNYISCTSSIDDTSLVPNGGNRNQISRFDGEVAGIDSNPALDIESSVISNILSLDLEAWDDSSPQNLAMLLGEPDKQHGSVKLSGSLKTQSSNQSRFSFARQGNSMNQLVNIEPSFNSGQESMSKFFSHAFVENREPYLHGIGNGFGFCEHNAEQIDKISSIHSITSCNKPSVSRAQLSAPPGFSMPSRPPLSGFSSQERNDQTFDVKSGSQLLDTSWLRNPYMTSPSGNTSGAGDIEFIDPAILAVGKGRLPSGAMNNSGFDMQPAFPSQLAAGNDAKLQLLMQSSLTPHQNLRYVGVGDSFLPNDSYGFASRHMEQSQTSNMASFSQFSLRPSTNAMMSNGQWDGWSEHQALNDVGIAEILTNGRLKFNRLYNDFEDKFQKPSAANLYSRTFGI